MEQNEIDALLKGIDATVEPEGEKTKSDDDLSWDDVQEELEQTKGASTKKTEVSNVNFQEVRKVKTPKGNLDIEFILDIPLTLNVELGRCHMLINELLQLGQGSVVELSKLAGEPMDVYVNSRLIARGEVVVVNDKFGVRLTDIVSTTERINKLK